MTTRDLEYLLCKTWLKLLKANVRNKNRKISKLESKMIQIELEKRYGK